MLTMKSLSKILLTSILFSLFACSGIKLVPIENAKTFPLEKNKNEIAKIS